MVVMSASRSWPFEDRFGMVGLDGLAAVGFRAAAQPQRVQQRAVAGEGGPRNPCVFFTGAVASGSDLGGGHRGLMDGTLVLGNCHGRGDGRVVRLLTIY